MNSLIKHIISLHTTQGRQLHKQFIAEGVRTIETLCATGHVPQKIFISDIFSNKNATLMHTLLANNAADCMHVTESIMRRISTATTPSGILVIFNIPPISSFASLTNGIVLVCMQDPGNVGTLIRTAAAMGKKSVVCIEGVDPWSPKVVQASAGTIGMVAIFRTSFDVLLAQKKNIPLCALVVENGKRPDEVDISNALIVVGNEAHGLPEQWIRAADFSITLPMPGKCESLNAAVAGSIALYLATSK